MGYSAQPDNEIYNPWTIVNLVFHHLVDEGLHPILGESGNPGEPAAALLVAMGVEPVAEGSRQARDQIRAQLDDLRAAAFGERDPDNDGGATASEAGQLRAPICCGRDCLLSHVESPEHPWACFSSCEDVSVSGRRDR